MAGWSCAGRSWRWHEPWVAIRSSTDERRTQTAIASARVRGLLEAAPGRHGVENASNDFHRRSCSSWGQGAGEQDMAARMIAEVTEVTGKYWDERQNDRVVGGR